MRYSYEYKRKCVELYRNGRWPETPDGIKDPENFRKMIRRWTRMEDANGPDVLKHKGQKKEWKPEERLELVSRVLAGASVTSVAIEAGISSGLLYQWVRKYKTEGYNGLVMMKIGRAPKEFPMKKLNYCHSSNGPVFCDLHGWSSVRQKRHHRKKRPASNRKSGNQAPDAGMDLFRLIL